MKYRFYVVERDKWEPLLGPYPTVREAFDNLYGSEEYKRCGSFHFYQVVSRTQLHDRVVRGERLYPRGPTGDRNIQLALEKNKKRMLGK